MFHRGIVENAKTRLNDDRNSLTNIETPGQYFWIRICSYVPIKRRFEAVIATDADYSRAFQLVFTLAVIPGDSRCFLGTAAVAHAPS